MLGNTSFIMRLNFRLTFSYSLELYYKTFLNNHHLYYLKLHQSENDEYQAINVAGSDNI